MSDLGVATSGRYERGDHIVDPRMKLPAVDLMSVTDLLSSLGIAAMAIADDTTVRPTPEFDRYRCA